MLDINANWAVSSNSDGSNVVTMAKVEIESAARAVQTRFAVVPIIECKSGWCSPTQTAREENSQRGLTYKSAARIYGVADWLDRMFKAWWKAQRQFLNRPPAIVAVKIPYIDRPIRSSKFVRCWHLTTTYSGRAQVRPSDLWADPMCGFQMLSKLR